MLLRYVLQKGAAVVSGTANAAHAAANLEVLDFALDAAAVEELETSEPLQLLTPPLWRAAPQSVS